MTVSSTRQLPTARAPSRRAMISAWAVGSWRSSRSLCPLARTSPLRTTTAPIGTSSCSNARSASRRARRMKKSSRGKKCSLICLAAASATVLPVLGTRGTPSLPKSMAICLPRHELSSCVRNVRLLALCLSACVMGLPASALAVVDPDGYASNEIVVRYAPASRASAASAGRSTPLASGGAHTTLVRLARGESVASALRQLRAQRDVQWAVPDYVAHATGSVARAAGGLIPNDVGSGTAPGEWQQLQWNFSGPFSINAPDAWANVAAD